MEMDVPPFAFNVTFLSALKGRQVCDGMRTESCLQIENCITGLELHGHTESRPGSEVAH